MKWLNPAEKAALMSGERTISHTQLIAAARDCASRLPAHAKRIALLGANSPEWVIALYGTWYGGAELVPIDFMSTVDEIAYILSDCGPEAIWCDTANRGKVEEATGKLAPEKRPQLMALESLQVPETADGSVSFPDVPGDRIALIIYTSGTTGAPKGVMLCFDNLWANTQACSEQIEVFIPEDRVLVALPLHHAYPLMATVIMPLSIGASAAFAPSLTSEGIMSALQTHHCTFIVGVPRLLELFRNAMMRKVNASLLGRLFYHVAVHCHSLWLSRRIFAKVQQAFGGCIRYISSGGAAADPLVTRDFYALGFQLLEGYGMTETAPMISFTPPWKHKPGSPGLPIPCNEVRIVDGEVQVRGKNVMVGYYGKPEETRQVLEPDGWLHTGDVGHVDDDGFLWLTGRLKELIILGNGKNINPDEIERKLMALSNGLLAECCVTEYGESMQLVAVPDKKTLEERQIVNIEETIKDEILEPYNVEAPSYKRILHLRLLDGQLPRTRLGKLRRHVVREMLSGEKAQTAVGQETAPADPVYRKIASYLEECVGRPVGPDEHLEMSLGLDSLGKMGLLSYLNEAFGDWIDEGVLVKHATARLLSQAIHNHEVSEKASVVAPSAGSQELPVPGCTHVLLNRTMGLFLKAISKVTVTGLQHVPKGPCILAPNHQSALDAFYVCLPFSREKLRTTYFYAISKFFQGKLKGSFAKRHNIIPMELNGDLRSSLGLLKRLLDAGNSVVIFPEGRRSVDGELDEFKSSFAKLALDAQVPIVPVRLDGPIHVLPRGRTFPALGQQVTVAFLPPIMPSMEDTPSSLSTAVRRLLEAAKSR